MTIREVIKLPNPALRRKATRVTVFDNDLRVLIQDMIETMRGEPGVGLAAPQINVAKRIIVVEYPENDEEEGSPVRLFTVVNPEITQASEETELGIEGCLSVPNYLGEVERALRITVQGYNQYGKKIRVEASDWLARIFQHEIDHLNGILFVDRAIRVFKPEDLKTQEYYNPEQHISVE